MRTTLRALGLAAAASLTLTLLTGCGPASLAGTVTVDGSCYNYDATDVTPPTTATTVPVAVKPCDGTAAGRNVLIMGSSTTACAGPSDAAHCYVNLVEAARPADHFTVIGRGGTYVGYGTPDQNWTQTTIPGGNDVVIVQLGINDWYVPVAPATYRTQVDNLLNRAHDANPTAKIYWLRTWMPAQGDTSDPRRSMWAQHEWVTADAVEAVGGKFIDMADSAGPYRSTDPADNGWHYDDNGHKRLADMVLGLI